MKLNNQSLFMAVFSLVFSAQFLCVDCKAMTDVIQTSEGRLEIKDGIATKSFTINVPSAGRYYCNFWLMPALHSDSTLTSFKILLNGNNIGKICPIMENWQSVSINNKPYIDLTKGDNTISISTGTVEIPEVESIKFSKNRKNTEFSSNLYNEYIDDIISQDGMVDKETSNDDICLLSDNDGALVVAQKSSLNYSFYKLLYLKEGEEFTASATTYFSQNALDLFYYGDTDSITNYINNLSWKQICEPVITPASNNITPMYKATIKVRIPLTGLYMLKPRTIKSKIASIANVSINGVSYNKVPIYYNHIDCVMPADGVKYTAYTVYDNPEIDDPMIFVEGNAGNRIVGFNDNISDNDRRLYSEPSEKDALVKLSYKVDTSGLHVTSNNSNNPQSSCMVYGGINISRPSFSPKRNSVRNIRPKDKGNSIVKVEIFDINGILLNNVEATDNGTVCIGKLNSGVYIVSTINEIGAKSTHKIIVK